MLIGRTSIRPIFMDQIMKVRIIQKDFENYTGPLAADTFVDGLSVDDVPERVALRYCALMDCVWEDGSPIVFTKLEEEPTAPVGRDTYLPEAEGKREVVGGHDGDPLYIEPLVSQSEVPPKVTQRYTIGQLETIADKQGINGLRAIAKPLGIRGTSINTLISEIMKVAGKEIELPPEVEVV